MIIEPDFLTHWKTQMLVDLLDGDAMAPLYIIRLWAHCQNRKAWKFTLSTNAIRAICQYRGDAKKLENALIEAERIERHGDTVEITGWKDVNASLIAAWHNGKKGGRPKKEKPVENPRVSHGKPNGNPLKTDKRREEESREERIDCTADKSAPSHSPFREFWSAYPRKIGKEKAKSSFARAIKRTNLETILSAIEAQSQSKQWRESNGQFIPHPATWLNQGRWDDEMDCQLTTATAQQF